MATINYRNAALWLNGVDLSGAVESASISYGAEMLDETAMGDDTRINKGGLKTWSLELNFHQDFTTSTSPGAQVDSTLWPLVGTTTCFDLRPLNQDSSGINPRWVGIGVVETYNPLGGSVGSLLDAACTIQSASSLARYTSAT